MASNLGAIRVALRAALVSMYASDTLIGILDGPGSTLNPVDVAWISRITSDINPATLAAASRPTDENYEAEVILSSGRNGPAETQVVVAARVDSMYSTLFEYFRTSPNHTLNVSANTWARVVRMVSEPSDNPQILEKGRNQTCTVTIAITTRV